jgi:hypothetical protein
MTYTRGPWTVERIEDDPDDPAGKVRYLVLEARDAGEVLAEVFDRPAPADPANMGPGLDGLANAWVMAAAPELLAALRSFQNYELPLAVRQTRAMAALAKAEGRG